MSEEEKKCLEHLEGKNSRIVIEDEECKIFEEGTEPPKFILGFTGAGLVGTIVTNELIKQMDMRQIGYVLSEDLPPITIFYEGILKHPFRLYYSDEQNILVSICEIPFVSGAYSDISRTLMDFALKNGIKDIICVQGLADKSFLPNEKEVKIFAAGEKKAMDRLDKYDLNKYLENNEIDVKSWFWRTTQQQEIDYIEEWENKLFAFEFKWNPQKKVRLSKTFANAYPTHKFKLITPENFYEFVMKM